MKREGYERRGRDSKGGEGQEGKMESMCHESRMGDYLGQERSQQEWGEGSGGQITARCHDICI